MRTPRILIGATGSGSGKTTITCALLEILKRQGKKVQAFKCGPDYIDPMFHRTVLGIPSKNLDTFFTGEKMTAELFMESAVNADISVMEGVMGLYDGLGGIRKEGSGDGDRHAGHFSHRCARNGEEHSSADRRFSFL